MAWSQTTITHKWVNPDLSAGTGTVKFTLERRMTNAGQSIPAGATITATLDTGGNLSQQLVSNVDAGTTPTDAQWRVDVNVAGASEDSYYITVPVGPGTVDLGTLIPEAQQVQ